MTKLKSYFPCFKPSSNTALPQLQVLEEAFEVLIPTDIFFEDEEDFQDTFFR